MPGSLHSLGSICQLDRTTRVLSLHRWRRKTPRVSRETSALALSIPYYDFRGKAPGAGAQQLLSVSDNHPLAPVSAPAL
jgi:hypothetical protein